MFCNGFCINSDNFVIFSFWDMVDFVLNIRSELVWDLEIFANLIQKR